MHCLTNGTLIFGLVCDPLWLSLKSRPLLQFEFINFLTFLAISENTDSLRNIWEDWQFTSHIFSHLAEPKRPDLSMNREKDICPVWDLSPVHFLLTVIIVSHRTGYTSTKLRLLARLQMQTLQLSINMLSYSSMWYFVNEFVLWYFRTPQTWHFPLKN